MQWNPSSTDLRKLFLLCVFSDYILYDVIPCCPLLFARVCGRVEGVSENDYWYGKKWNLPRIKNHLPVYLQTPNTCREQENPAFHVNSVWPDPSAMCLFWLSCDLLWSLSLLLHLGSPGCQPASLSLSAPILVPSSLSCHSWAYLFLISHSHQCDSSQDSDMRSFHGPPTWSLEVSSGLRMIQTTKETILVILFQEDSSLFIFYFILT